MKIIEDGTVTNPKGYKGAGLHIGIKKRNKDFALIVSDVEAKAVGTFTTNMVKAAPVLWDKQVVENSDTVKAIAINNFPYWYKVKRISLYHYEIECKKMQNYFDQTDVIGSLLIKKL